MNLRKLPMTDQFSFMNSLKTAPSIGYFWNYFIHQNVNNSMRSQMYGNMLLV